MQPMEPKCVAKPGVNEPTQPWVSSIRYTNFCSKFGGYFLPDVERSSSTRPSAFRYPIPLWNAKPLQRMKVMYANFQIRAEIGNHIETFVDLTQVMVKNYHR